MLKEISKERALELLNEPKTSLKVYFKHMSQYLRVMDYRWTLSHIETFQYSFNFYKQNFYEEVE